MWYLPRTSFSSLFRPAIVRLAPLAAVGWFLSGLGCVDCLHNVYGIRNANSTGLRPSSLLNVLLIPQAVMIKSEFDHNSISEFLL